MEAQAARDPSTDEASIKAHLEGNPAQPGYERTPAFMSILSSYGAAKVSG